MLSWAIRIHRNEFGVCVSVYVITQNGRLTMMYWVGGWWCYDAGGSCYHMHGKFIFN